MTTVDEPARAPVDRVEDIEAILKAMTEAVREAVWRHKRLGDSVAIWRDGRVVWLSADEIPDEFEHRNAGDSRLKP